MTMYESNRDVHETGAEAGEFVDTPANEPGDDDTPEAAEEDDDEDAPDAKMYTSEPVETEAGVRVIRQQNVGPGNEEGGGEWPDPHTPPVQ